jgi:hypothetical protein
MPANSKPSHRDYFIFQPLIELPLYAGERNDVKRRLDRQGSGERFKGDWVEAGNVWVIVKY